MRLAPPRKLGHVGVLEAVDGTVLMTAEGVHIYLATVPPVAAPFASRVSAAHHVGTDEHWQASLMGLLQSRQQTQLAALLEVRSVRHTEWFAEHARAQLDPKGRCSSKPAWVAWCASWASLEDGGDEETLFVATRMASSFSMFRIKHGDGDVFTDGLVAKNAVDPELLDCALEAIERIGLPADPGLALLAAVITQARQESSQARVDQLLEDPNTRAIYERVQAELAKTDSEKEDGDGDGDGRRDDGEDG